MNLLVLNTTHKTRSTAPSNRTARIKESINKSKITRILVYEFFKKSLYYLYYKPNDKKQINLTRQ